MPTSTVVLTATPSPMPTRAPITVDNAADLLNQALDVDGTPLKAAWQPDGSVLAVLTTTAIGLYDNPANPQAKPQRIEGYSGGGVDMAFSPDSSFLATAGDGVHVWRTDSGEEEITSPLASTSLAFSPDSTLLAVGTIDGRIVLLELPSGDIAAQFAIGIEVWSLAFSIDGSLLASSGADSQIRLWNITEKRSLNTIAAGGKIRSLAFSPDDILLASGSDEGIVKLWSVVSAQEMATLSGHTGHVTSVAFHPFELILASAGEDGTLRLWDTAIGQSLATQKACSGGIVGSVAWSPDGTMLATTGSAGALNLWSMLPGGTGSR
jgi:WD40 repeat protein